MRSVRRARRFRRLRLQPDQQIRGFLFNRFQCRSLGGSSDRAIDRVPSNRIARLFDSSSVTRVHPLRHPWRLGWMGGWVGGWVVCVCVYSAVSSKSVAKIETTEPGKRNRGSGEEEKKERTKVHTVQRPGRKRNCGRASERVIGGKREISREDVLEEDRRQRDRGRRVNPLARIVSLEKILTSFCIRVYQVRPRSQRPRPPFASCSRGSSEIVRFPSQRTLARNIPPSLFYAYHPSSSIHRYYRTTNRREPSDVTL